MNDLTASTPKYRDVHSEIVLLLDAARRNAARSVNAVMTTAYWEIGRRMWPPERTCMNSAGMKLRMDFPAHAPGLWAFLA